MNIRFSTTGPDAEDTLILPVSSAGMADISGRVPESLRGSIASAAQQARFEGAAGTSFEVWASEGATTRRVVLVGAGNGDGAGFERAGGAAVARLLTSGAVSAHADLAGVEGGAAARIRVGRYLAGMAD